MRYAIFSDIHGNLPAWKQVLADIRDLKADVLICLGDVVGYGPKPQEVLDEIRSVTDHFVLGNHDAAAAGLIDPSIFNDHAHSVVLWTRENLTKESLEFLSNVPLQLDAENILFVHAEITNPSRFGYIEESENAKENFSACDHFVTFIGHTHHPLIFEQQPDGQVKQLPDTDRELDPKCRYIVNVGSAGEPRNPDDIRARYVIYDTDSQKVFFRRIDFDADIYRKDLETTTLTHAPYFLQVLDHVSELEDTKAQDMQALSQDMQGFKNTRRIKINTLPVVAGEKPKPKPIPDSTTQTTPPPSKRKKIAGMIIGSSVMLLVCGWWYLHERSKAALAEALLLEKNRAMSAAVPQIEKPPENPQDIASMTPRERLYSSEALPLIVESDEKKQNKSEPDQTAVKIEPEMAKVVAPKPVSPPSPEPKPTPIPIDTPKPAPAPPPFETIAHWPMNSDSVEGNLLAGEGEIQLHQVLAAKPFDKIAPDPLPQTSGANPSSLARGAWIEKEPSGKFELSSDSSFAFEGWVLISPDQPPVFIGGTQNNNDEAGWRLDLKSASSPEGTGSIRFQYSNGSNTITAQNNEIPLNQATPHYIAAVWNHQSINQNTGRLEVYFDNELVGKTEIPHSEIANADSQPILSSFRLSSPDNPERIAMDEFRFSRGKLTPNDFLSNKPGPIPGGVAENTGMKRGRLLYAVDDDQFNFDSKYTKDHSAEISPDSFSRVGYFIELGDDWVWVSMDRFQTDPKLLGVPKAKTNIVETGTVVTNLVIDSNRADLKALNRPGLTGIIEFWASNHGGNGEGKFGSNDGRFDWKDSGGTTQPGHGSFQIFAFTNEEQTAAVTLFGVSRTGGSGIGDQSGDSVNAKRAPDWTFGPGANTYKKRNLEIFVGD